MKIACTADIHVGAYGKKLDAETGLNARLLDHINTLDWIVNDTKQRDCDALLIAGDLFKSARPTPTELVLTRGVLDTSNEAFVVAIPGNHDLPRAAGEFNAIDPVASSNIHLINKPHTISFDGVQIATLPYPNRATFAAVAEDYAAMTPDEVDAAMSEHLKRVLQGLAAEIDPAWPSVLLAHGSIDAAELGAERGIMAGRDVTIPLDAIPDVFTFGVFGHIHKPQSFEAHGRPNVFYTGSPERIDFGEEREDKSYVVIDTDAGTWERVRIPCRDYRTIDVRHTENGFEPEGAVDAADTVCRIRICRDESYRPDYEDLETLADGCWDFRGFVEDVDRAAAVRSEEIVNAQTLAELIGLWHTQTECLHPLDPLVAAGEELERSVG